VDVVTRCGGSFERLRSIHCLFSLSHEALFSHVFARSTGRKYHHMPFFAFVFSSPSAGVFIDRRAVSRAARVRCVWIENTGYVVILHECVVQMCTRDVMVILGKSRMLSHLTTRYHLCITVHACHGHETSATRTGDLDINWIVCMSSAIVS
jgi:hypothetical protein